MKLKPHQVTFNNDILTAWQSHQNVLGVMPTGGGKTFSFSMLAKSMQAPGVIFAHRDVLLEQISLSLAKVGVPHAIMCSDRARNLIRESHYDTYGEFCHDHKSPITVVGVDTANARLKKGYLKPISQRAQWWVMDEAHHILLENKWGNVLQEFQHCRGLGVTATPIRSDKKGLGRSADGVFDTMVTSLNMRDLIEQGVLCDYQIIASPLAKQTANKFKQVKVTGSGDYSAKESKPLLDTRTVIGDVVSTYLQHAPGKRAITFGFDIEHCEHLAEAYKAAGVSAIALSSKTPATERKQMLKAFRAGQIKVLVNCDLFGEGFDVPGVELVQMVRKTLSYSLYVQQFGRALRVLAGKPYALIIDHVGNVAEHKLPDFGLDWSLDRPPKATKRKNDTESDHSLTTCTNPACMRVYELPAAQCPYCGQKPQSTPRGEVKYVEGELVPLTPDELLQLRHQAALNTREPQQLRQYLVGIGKHPAYANLLASNHNKTYQAQQALQAALHGWAHQAHSKGLSAEQAREQFTKLYGVDPLTAQTYKVKDAERLLDAINRA